jgi:hypothetical protein
MFESWRLSSLSTYCERLFSVVVQRHSSSTTLHRRYRWNRRKQWFHGARARAPRGTNSRRLPQARSMAGFGCFVVTKQIAEALEGAHERSIIHRVRRHALVLEVPTTILNSKRIATQLKECYSCLPLPGSHSRLILWLSPSGLLAFLQKCIAVCARLPRRR